MCVIVVCVHASESERGGGDREEKKRRPTMIRKYITMNEPKDCFVLIFFDIASKETTSIYVAVKKKCRVN